MINPKDHIISYCFKPLTFEMVCFTAISKQNNDYKYTYFTDTETEAYEDLINYRSHIKEMIK